MPSGDGDTLPPVPPSPAYTRGYTVTIMRSPGSVGMRLVRTLLLAGSSVGLGSVAHQHAGDSSIGAGAVVAVLAVVALSWGATARLVRWPVIAAILGGGQLLTHLALSSGHPTGGFGGGAEIASSSQALQAHSHLVPGSVTLTSSGGLDLHMLLMHALAWVVLTILFTVGERTLWRSVDRLLRPWRLLPPPAPAVAPRGSHLVLLVPVSALAHRRCLGRAPPLG